MRKSAAQRKRFPYSETEPVRNIPRFVWWVAFENGENLIVITTCNRLGIEDIVSQVNSKEEGRKFKVRQLAGGEYPFMPDDKAYCFYATNDGKLINQDFQVEV